MQIKGIGKEGSNKFLYNGKEHDETTGWDEYEARMHDPQLGRFIAIDLLAEDYNFQSPYAYAANDPINNIDYLGMGPGGSVVDKIVKKVVDGVVNLFKFLTGKASGQEKANKVAEILLPKNTLNIVFKNSSGKADEITEEEVVGAAGEIVNFGAAFLTMGESRVATIADDVANVADDVARVADDVANVADNVANVADNVATVVDDVATTTSRSGGRSGKQARIRAIADDPKASSYDRGWVRNEARRISSGNGSKNYRLPRNGRRSPGRKRADKGYELAHRHDRPASQGHGYDGSLLKNHADHKVETRIHRRAGRY